MNKTNPFYENKAISVDKFFDWSQFNSKPYDKGTASPFTKTRVILMNGTEFEANWFSHQFSRHCNNNDLRREIANIRRHEQQQQKIISSLKPIDESNLETTISYEQLAVDLTAILAKHVKDDKIKEQLNFALLEDFDHLYRFSNLLEMEQGISAKDITKEYTEIMPARPTISEHRHPYNAINNFICNRVADPFDKLVTNIITAAEQQTMNYYMNIGSIHPTELGRKLYAEIAMIEEQHVSEYGSLIDPNCSWLENWLMHEYTECYLYYSCSLDETDERIKKLYENLYLQECGHLQKVAELLLKYEGKPWQSVFTCGGDFPDPIVFDGNIDYIRDVIAKTVASSKYRDLYMKVDKLPKDAYFCEYNNMVNKKVENVASHEVIVAHINEYGEDYRYESKKHPIAELSSRIEDNTTLGRC